MRTQASRLAHKHMCMYRRLVPGVACMRQGWHTSKRAGEPIVAQMRSGPVGKVSRHVFRVEHNGAHANKCMHGFNQGGGIALRLGHSTHTSALFNQPRSKYSKIHSLHRCVITTTLQGVHRHQLRTVQGSKVMCD